MKVPFVLIAVAVLSLEALPAQAQYANEFTPAKLVKQGKTDKPIAGSGSVTVQVQVNADGTHKAIKVIHSTNHGDDAAAMDIAQNSVYRPAHRGSHPETSFYDFALKFNGKSVASSSQHSGVSTAGLSPAAERIANMIASKQYDAAKSSAQAALLSAPSDVSLREMLGIASYDAGDYDTAAAAFIKVDSIGPQFVPIAAASLASAAVKNSQSNPSLALQYAQRAVALKADDNSRFALGVAQLASGQNASALATLKQVHDSVMNDPKLGTPAKVNIDAQLVAAYLANDDSQNAQAIAAEIKKLDPNSTAASTVIGSHLLKAGVTAQNAKDNATALKDYEEAAAQGSPEVAATANEQAAFLIASETHPDYAKMQAYADKAVALKPNDPQANFAEGIALAGQWAGKHDEALKQKALDALNKADQQAKAAGNEGLSLQIETFIKQNLNATPGAQSGSGG